MSFLKQLQKKYSVTAAWEQEHEKMYKENRWYKAWYDTMKESHKLKTTLAGLAQTVDVYLKHYEQLPEGCDKQEWRGYVLVTENSIKHVLEEGQEAEKVVKTLGDLRK